MPGDERRGQRDLARRGRDAEARRIHAVVVDGGLRRLRHERRRAVDVRLAEALGPRSAREVRLGLLPRRALSPLRRVEQREMARRRGGHLLVLHADGRLRLPVDRRRARACVNGRLPDYLHHRSGAGGGLARRADHRRQRHQPRPHGARWRQRQRAGDRLQCVERGADDVQRRNGGDAVRGPGRRQRIPARPSAGGFPDIPVLREGRHGRRGHAGRLVPRRGHAALAQRRPAGVGRRPHGRRREEYRVRLLGPCSRRRTPRVSRSRTR